MCLAPPAASSAAPPPTHPPYTCPHPVARSAERATEANSELHLSVAVSYSGRADVTAAARRLAARVAAGQLAPQHITAGMLEAELATAALPLGCRHPDLIVRTSGERRLSNFLCWEAAYSGGVRGEGGEGCLCRGGPCEGGSAGTRCASREFACAAQPEGAGTGGTAGHDW